MTHLALDLIVPSALSFLVHALIALPVLALCALCLWLLPWTDEELHASADALRALRGASARVARAVQRVTSRHRAHEPAPARGTAARSPRGRRAPRGAIATAFATAASLTVAVMSAPKGPL
jgi:ferric-dicitrate binding protein FerR (iron transport regulator)